MGALQKILLVIVRSYMEDGRGVAAPHPVFAKGRAEKMQAYRSTHMATNPNWGGGAPGIA
jgi:hypothetical protein